MVGAKRPDRATIFYLNDLHVPQPISFTATRLTELDLPLDWTEQHRLLAS
jgi:hypothetical protein